MTKEIFAEKMVEEIWAIVSPILTKYFELDYTWMVNPNAVYTMTGMDYIKGLFFLFACICLIAFLLGYLCGKSKAFCVIKGTILKGIVRMGYYAGCTFCIVLYPFLHHGMLPSKREIQRIKRIWLEG